MVLREVLLLTGLSVGIALPLAIALSKLVKGELFGVSDRDPVTLLIVTVAIGVVALLAAWVPARRATRVQPTTALRYE
jgi:ABC-type antimicrobial peptide transport system permease subunit